MKKLFLLALVAAPCWTGCVAVPPLINVNHRDADPDIRARLDSIERRLDRIDNRLDQLEKKP